MNKYNSEPYRCRGVDARQLGRMLDSDMPIGCGDMHGRTQTEGCGSRAGVRGARSEGETSPVPQVCTPTSDSPMLASACRGTPSLAAVYSPYQHFVNIYPTDKALSRGTLFCELDKPWKAGGTR